MEKFDLKKWPGFLEAGGVDSHDTVVDEIVIDSRQVSSPRSVFIALKGGNRDGHAFIPEAVRKGAKFVIVEKLPADLNKKVVYLQVPNTLRALQEIAACYRQSLPTKIIGISGSFGKTMVKDLLQRFLATQKMTAASPESFNSQVGVPLSLLTLTSKDEVAIIEAAISKENEMEALTEMIHPDYTIITPVGKKHLASMNDLDTLKREIEKFANATSDRGWILYPSSLPISQANCVKYAWDKKESHFPYSYEEKLGDHFFNRYFVTFPDQTVYHGKMDQGYVYFINLINMAIKAAWLLKISKENICETLKTFLPEPMTTEMWRSPNGINFINEPYCSSAISIQKSLEHFKLAPANARKLYAFGGMRGHGSELEQAYRTAALAFAGAGLESLVLYGNHSYQALIPLCEQLSPQTAIFVFTDQIEAFAFLNRHLLPNDYLILKGEKKLSLDYVTEIFHDSLSNNQCWINLASIRENIKLIQKKVGERTKLMIVVKALAYGTDDIRLAKFLSLCGIDYLCVSHVDEGVSLKRSGVSQSIFCINAAPYEAAKIVKWDLEVGVSQPTLIEALALEAKIQKKQVKVHLHIDTGMSRFGCRRESVVELAEMIKNYPELILEGVMTHFSCADDPKEDDFTRQQIQRFDDAIAALKERGIEPNWLHAANSSGALRFALPQYNMARIGLAAYGLYQSSEANPTLDLRLSLSLTSKIVGLNWVKKGETVSYGKSYTVEKESQLIAIIPIGYYDGIHRNYSGKGTVMIRGIEAPMIGAICMDYMMVDVTDVSDVEIGDRVLIFGYDEFGHFIAPEELAKRGNSIVHELITCLGPRIQRIFIDEESHTNR